MFFFSWFPLRCFLTWSLSARHCLGFTCQFIESVPVHDFVPMCLFALLWQGGIRVISLWPCFSSLRQAEDWGIKAYCPCRTWIEMWTLDKTSAYLLVATIHPLPPNTLTTLSCQPQCFFSNSNSCLLWSDNVLGVLPCCSNTLYT